MTGILERGLDWIYPRRCPICDEIRKRNSPPVCERCRKNLYWIREPRCKKCGKPVGERQEFCSDCRKKVHKYKQGYAVFVYHRGMQASMMRFKEQGRQEYAEFYARMMQMTGEELLRIWKPDFLVPVPIHPSKRRRRGYNQAEVLAEELGKLLNLPVRTDLVKRIRKTGAQKSLTPDQRRKNLRDAFCGTSMALHGENILIIDDIYTTGSTVDAVTEVLQNMGAGSVYFAAVCIGNGE